MRPISHIVVHTAAAARGGKPVDQTAAAIRGFHTRSRKEGGRGWSDIGYHYVVRFDGSVEKGRPERLAGAHVRGFNARTLGVCFTGHGDHADFTPRQKVAGHRLVYDLLKKHNLVGEFLQNPMRVLGHRECDGLPGVPRSFKSCPGAKVSMPEFRLAVLGLVAAAPQVRADEDAEDEPIPEDQL